MEQLLSEASCLRSGTREVQSGVQSAYLTERTGDIWSGRRDLNSGPPAPKFSSKMLSSCLVYDFRASSITVLGGFRQLLFPNCSQVFPIFARSRREAGVILSARFGHAIRCSTTHRHNERAHSPNRVLGEPSRQGPAFRGLGYCSAFASEQPHLLRTTLEGPRYGNTGYGSPRHTPARNADCNARRPLTPLQRRTAE